jgi:hypothetical protein
MVRKMLVLVMLAGAILVGCSSVSQNAGNDSTLNVGSSGEVKICLDTGTASKAIITNVVATVTNAAVSLRVEGIGHPSPGIALGSFNWTNGAPTTYVFDNNGIWYSSGAPGGYYITVVETDTKNTIITNTGFFQMNIGQNQLVNVQLGGNIVITVQNHW